MVSAAVTVVILNLFFWFSTHVFFSETFILSKLGSTTTLPQLQSVQFAPIIISLVAMSVRKKLGVLGTILLCATIPMIFEL